MKKLKINHLDHVAIRVKDLEATAEWYTKVLGLKKVQTDKWGRYPIFLLAGQTGIAVFPHLDSYHNAKVSTYKWTDHFAFNVDNENFEIAKTNLKDLAISFTFEDHYFFHSIYIKDPDGHIVELTTLIKEGDVFYGND